MDSILDGHSGVRLKGSLRAVKKFRLNNTGYLKINQTDKTLGCKVSPPHMHTRKICSDGDFYFYFILFIFCSE